MIGTVVFIAIPAIAIYVFRKRNEKKWGMCLNKESLEGKNVIITGANSGIGFETAKDLAKRGATIILACRNETLANQAIVNIRREIRMPDAKLVFVELDLASIKSIKRFVNQILENYDKIDILINNAGVHYSDGTRQKVTTDDNFEIHFGTNYLGHFMLTHQLGQLLEKSGKARVINVSSILYSKGVIDLNNLNYDVTPPRNPYADSKLLNMYHSVELSRRFKDKGVNVYTVYPGWVYTNLFRHSTKNIFKVLVALPIALLFMRSRRQGAQTSIYCATEKSLDNKTGQFYRDCSVYIPDYTFDAGKTMELWEKSEKLLNL